MPLPTEKENWMKSVPIYKNGSTAIPKGEPVVQVSAVQKLLTSQRTDIIREIGDHRIAACPPEYRDERDVVNGTIENIIQSIKEE